MLKKIINRFYKLVSSFFNEIISFTPSHVFEYFHQKFPKIKWLHVSYYFFKDQCPLRAAGLSFYTITYMVSGVFLVIFISDLFQLDFAESVVTYLFNLIVPSEVAPTTEYIVNFSKEILEFKGIIYIASIIAIYNMILLLTEIKDNFDEIMDHYYTKSSGAFIRNQLIKIFSVFGFIIVFHFFIQPLANQISQLTFGTILIKYLFIFLLLWALFNHTSNKIQRLLTFKAAFISSLMLFLLEYLIFDLLADKHAFFGRDHHSGAGIGIFFLFPFWVYLAWNFIFIGLEYIATFTKENIQKHPIEVENYILLSVLEQLYQNGSVSCQYITKRFSITYRYFQERILHALKRLNYVDYDFKSDMIISLPNWEEKAIFELIKSKHVLINLNELRKIQFLSKMNNDELKKISFKSYFEMKQISEKDESLEEKSLWERIKDLF